MIRVTGGRLKGRTIAVATTRELRPTGAKVRAALFNLIGHELDGRSLLDPFAGAGVLAIEAISRGAGPATLLERDGRALHQLRRTLAELEIEATLIRDDARTFAPWALGRGLTWNLVLLDPPYKLEPSEWAALYAPLCSGTMVVEHDARQSVEIPTGFVLDRRRDYGDTALTLLVSG